MISTGSTHEKSKKGRGKGEKGESGTKNAGELRWQVLLPERGGSCTQLQHQGNTALTIPISTCLPHALASPLEFPGARQGPVRYTGAAGNHFTVCLVCTWSQPCLNRMGDRRLVASLNIHFWQSMVQESSTKPYKATCDPQGLPTEEHAACVYNYMDPPSLLLGVCSLQLPSHKDHPGVKRKIY